MANGAFHSGEYAGAYRLISRSENKKWNVECASCGTPYIMTSRALVASEAKREIMCPGCATQDKSPTKKAKERPRDAMTTRVDDISMKVESLLKRVFALESKPDPATMEYRLNKLKHRSAHAISKELIFTEIFAFLNLSKSTAKISDSEYIDKLAALMRLIEGAPAKWWHDRREHKIGAWADLLDMGTVNGLIEVMLQEPAVEEDENEELRG